ncbi:hypothetical protein [Aestuariibius sp. HNIBRBA575]|uniref:hypothetical protein n=1 Tax=Aestuariibius sp. HNIBRBA575 TaxID=3233343 RepID=UPI0034A40DCF
MIIGDKVQFGFFFNKVLEAEMYQLNEGYFVHLPKALIDDHVYQGSVENSWKPKLEPIRHRFHASGSTSHTPSHSAM